MSIFYEKLAARITLTDSLVCVGLDSELSKLPGHLRQKPFPQATFNTAIIEATHDLVSSYKLNTAFYEARGVEGIVELKMTCDYLRQQYPDIVVILDAKRADIGNTNAGYATFIFDYLGADAITLHPYLGREALQPFLDRKDKGCIILCRTSNPGAGELQDLLVNGEPLYQLVARQVAEQWNQNENCALVVGATYPEEMRLIREIAPTMPLLIPGIGAQGGDLAATVKSGIDALGGGALIHSARGIIFAAAGLDFAEQARQATQTLQQESNRFRKGTL